MAFMKTILIEGYRGIKNLEIGQLKPVNIIAGDNNCGKTSILEAISLLRTSGSLANVYKVARQRENFSASNANSLFDSFLCMFPRDSRGKLEIAVFGICSDENISFRLSGKKDRILLDADELSESDEFLHFQNMEMEAEAFTGIIQTEFGSEKKKNTINIHQYSSITGTSTSEQDKFNVVYVSSLEHLGGNVMDSIIGNEAYKQICIKALQLLDPDIEDMMIFGSDIGNRPVEYLRHKKLGDMPVSSYGSGIKRLLALANAITVASDGILLIDGIETAMHKKHYEEIFRFLVKACRESSVQVFATTHSLEAIDGLLGTQNYENQTDTDDICVCTIKKVEDRSFARVLSGREVYENREAFGFEVRL